MHTMYIKLATLIVCWAATIEAVTVYDQIPLALATTGTAVSPFFTSRPPAWPRLSGAGAPDASLVREQPLLRTLRRMILVC
jgi:hypothetical protein